MMSSVVALQINGLGSVFQCAAQALMTSSRSALLNTPRQAPVGELFEPAFDEVRQGTCRRGEVQMPAAPVLVRANHLVFSGALSGGQLVQHDVDGQAARDGRVDLL
jgi:hypothetical protein